MELTETELNEIYQTFTDRYRDFISDSRLEERDEGYVIWCRAINDTKHSKIPLSFRNVKIVPVLWKPAK